MKCRVCHMARHGKGVKGPSWVATTWVMPLTITLSTQLNVQQPFNVQHSPATLVNGQWVFWSLGLPSSIFQSLSSHLPCGVSVFGIWYFALVSFGHRTSAACAPSNCAACHRQSAAGASNSTNAAIGQWQQRTHTHTHLTH